MMAGAIGHAALKDHTAGGGSVALFDSHVTLCVLCGITSFLLLCSSIQLFRYRFLPEMMMVYSIRNLAMLVLFTGKTQRNKNNGKFVISCDNSRNFHVVN